MDQKFGKTQFLPDEYKHIIDLVVNSAGALLYVIDLETFEILYINERCKEDFGEIVGSPCFKVLQQGQEGPCLFCPQYERPHNVEELIGQEYHWENHNTRNGKTYIFNDRIVRWKDGRTVKVQVGIDISEQKALSQELQSNHKKMLDLFEALLDATIEGLLIFDNEKKCIRTNKIAPAMLGYDPEEMIGMVAFDFIAPASVDLVKSVIGNADQSPYEALLRRKDGSIFPALLRGRDFDFDGQMIRCSAIMDISQIKEKEATITKMALYDGVTGLANRSYLLTILDRAIVQSQRSRHYNALLFIDLDHFKEINDTKGHAMGDKVLCETARRIVHCIREEDFVARLGGDEFVIFIDTNDSRKGHALRTVELVTQKILDVISQPYKIDDFHFHLTASIGIVLFSDEPVTSDDVMKYADSAMYHAKESGRNTYRFFDPSLQYMLEEKAILTQALRDALGTDALHLCYQNQILVDKERRVVGVEALVRWNDPRNGTISPGKFIPIAETSGLIIPLGEWIMKEALYQLKTWENDPERSHWRISVNVSSKQFEQDNFVERLKEMISYVQIEPSKLRLELTESLLIQDTEGALSKIGELKALGVTLSIDDFGTGYSSLSYLKQLPIDELKIDQSFIRDIVTDPNDEIIVQTIISIGRKFGLEVIAEGVETQEQYEALVSMGCEYFQGYLFGRPVTVDAL